MTELRDPAQRGGITPLRRQYLLVKKQYPDVILLFPPRRISTRPWCEPGQRQHYTRRRGIGVAH